MSIRLENGDLFAVECDALAHGVNTKGVMGGIAGAFNQKYPESSDFYQAMCKVDGLRPGENYNDYENGKFILHVVSQDQPGADASEERLLLGLVGAVRDLIVDTQAENREEKIVVAMPLIGCGIGGLNFMDFFNVLLSVAFMFNNYVDFVVVYNDTNAHMIPDNLKYQTEVDTTVPAL